MMGGLSFLFFFFFFLNSCSHGHVLQKGNELGNQLNIFRLLYFINDVDLNKSQLPCRHKLSLVKMICLFIYFGYNISMFI